MLGKIGSMEPFAGCIAVNSERTTRERLHANQISDTPVSSLRRNDCANVQTETATLRFTCVHRQVWITENEATDNICPAGNRLQRHTTHVVLGPMKLVLVENRAGGHDRPKPCQVEAPPPWRIPS